LFLLRRNSWRKRLEDKIWKVGTAREFLRLTDPEESYVKLRLKLADALKRQRIRRNRTQADLAKTMKSSQSRVAKMESGDASVPRSSRPLASHDWHVQQGARESYCRLSNR
jgi:ribosome-binding protein aMBF1 (putative translation factor)